MTSFLRTPYSSIKLFRGYIPIVFSSEMLGFILWSIIVTCRNPDISLSFLSFWVQYYSVQIFLYLLMSYYPLPLWNCWNEWSISHDKLLFFSRKDAISRILRALSLCWAFSSFWGLWFIYSTRLWDLVQGILFLVLDLEIVSMCVILCLKQWQI